MTEEEGEAEGENRRKEVFWKQRNSKKSIDNSAKFTLRMHFCLDKVPFLAFSIQSPFRKGDSLSQGKEIRLGAAIYLVIEAKNVTCLLGVNSQER